MKVKFGASINVFALMLILSSSDNNPLHILSFSDDVLDEDVSADQAIAANINKLNPSFTKVKFGTSLLSIYILYLLFYIGIYIFDYHVV
jgi:hypothetical protein